MTGTFSSDARSCSEEVLAAAGASASLSVEGDVAAAAGVPLGLVFSVAGGAAGEVGLDAVGDGSGAGHVSCVFCFRGGRRVAMTYLQLWHCRLRRQSWAVVEAYLGPPRSQRRDRSWQCLAEQKT